MSSHYDELETRSADAREAEQLALLQAQVRRVQEGMGSCFPQGAVNSVTDLAQFPVLRKSTLSEWQKAQPPFGGVIMGEYQQVFQSPGPIYEPGGVGHDWWRFARFLHTCGIGSGDVVQLLWVSPDPGGAYV